LILKGETDHSIIIIFHHGPARTDNRQHEQGLRLSEDRLIAVAHIDKKAFLGTPMATMMLSMDAELPGRMCKIQGEYIQEVIAVTPAPHTHTYKPVMTSAGARNEVMDRVDMIGRFLPSLGVCSPNGLGNDCIEAHLKNSDSKKWDMDTRSIPIDSISHWSLQVSYLRLPYMCFDCMEASIQLPADL
jgi:hypothetical protein